MEKGNSSFKTSSMLPRDKWKHHFYGLSTTTLRLIQDQLNHCKLNLNPFFSSFFTYKDPVKYTSPGPLLVYQEYSAFVNWIRFSYRVFSCLLVLSNSEKIWSALITDRNTQMLECNEKFDTLKKHVEDKKLHDCFKSTHFWKTDNQKKEKLKYSLQLAYEVKTSSDYSTITMRNTFFVLGEKGKFHYLLTLWWTKSIEKIYWN